MPPPPAGAPIDPNTTLGAVRLHVAGLARAQADDSLVERLRTLDRHGDTVRLGADEARPMVELVGRPDAPRRPHGTTGLFHLAILLPSRLELARAFRRMAETRWPLTGAADHLVSEALYLDDPERNGIEIYRDRPREDWRYLDGELQMDTLPLDLDGVIGELTGPDSEAGGVPADARIGHVHLQVADLVEAEAFYHDALGFEVTVRGYPGALFLSAGGYHHHIGLNTWAGEGAPAPPPGSLGLSWFEVVLSSEEELGRVNERLRAAGVEGQSDQSGLRVADPSGNGVLLRAPAPTIAGSGDSASAEAA
jgi:catechol 2,3-dioxygenase